MPATRLSPPERRRVILEALEGQRSREDIAADAGISRQRLYQLLVRARHDPAAATADAREEYLFASKVQALLAAQRIKDNGKAS